MPRVVSYDQIGIMGAALRAASVRHDVLADNIANSNTPGFRRSEVQFEEVLQRALRGPQPLRLLETDPRHLPGPGRVSAPEAVRPRVLVEAETFSRNDRSNVNPEIEQIEMAKNAMWAQAVSTRLRLNLAGLRDLVRRAGAAQ